MTDEAAVPGSRPRALVYGDVDLNIIDGSAIWLLTAAEAFSRAGCDVVVVLKAEVRTARLVDELAALPGVVVRRPVEERLVPPATTAMGPAQAAGLLHRLDEEDRFDLVVLRGFALTERVVADGHLNGRLWTYLTDVPQSVPAMTPEVMGRLSRIADASAAMLCQTEELRCFLETMVPGAAGRCWLFPPAVRDDDFTTPAGPPAGRPGTDRPIRLVYSGKMAPLWRTVEMTNLPAALRDVGTRAELHVLGDKVHTPANDPGWAGRMRVALETPGVVWHGGMSRTRALEAAAGCDLGLSWRDPALDASLELSTKLLEYGAVGLPVLLNRTVVHESLLGADYPLFAATEADVVDRVRAVVTDPALARLAAARCRDAAERYRLDALVARLRGYLARIFPVAPPRIRAGRRGRPLRLLVAGHDLKFFTRTLDHLRALPGLDLRLDEWATLRDHDPEHSRALLEWADVVFVEWCGPAAAWYSEHKRRGQRLLVRLHRVELYAPWPEQVRIKAVDQVVCVSPHYARLTRERTGWPAEKIVVIPNWVDVAQLDRPKLPGAEHNVGMIGIAPMRKRPDLALDVLRILRLRDPRYRLLVKTKMPWEYPWIWRQPEEHAATLGLLRRIGSDPVLRGAVTFDAFGADVGAWLRRVGFVLSTSDDESFHLAPAEGMASGAVPVVRGWPGATEIYDPRWVHDSVEELADAVHAVVTSGRWDQERREAQQWVREAFDLPSVNASFVRLLTDDLPPGEPLMARAGRDAAVAAPAGG